MADVAIAGSASMRFFTRSCRSSARSRLQTWIRDSRVLVAGKMEKPSYQLRGGEAIEVEPALEPLKATAEDIPLHVLYEDESAVAIDKAAGMVVHAGAGVHDGTVVNALLHRFHMLSAVGGDERPGIVHRLDRFTSGVLLVAKTDAAHRDIALQFSSRKVEKTYIGAGRGFHAGFEGTDRITKPIITGSRQNRARMTARLKTGRTALTDWEAVEQFRRLHAAAHPARHRAHAPDPRPYGVAGASGGRRHQIRAHMASLGHRWPAIFCMARSHRRGTGISCMPNG